MAKKIKIGYIPWFEKSKLTYGHGPLNYYGWYELANSPILPKLDIWKTGSQGFLQCPAFKRYVDQIWMITSYVDVTMKWDKKHKVLNSNLPQMAHEAMCKVHWGDFDPDKDHPIVALNTSTVFLSDEDVWIEFVPPYYHLDPKWRLMPGSFNICNWQRPVIPTFEMLENEITIKRGQPLAYIRFRSKDPQAVYILEKMARTDDIEHLVNSSVSLKNYMPNISWSIVTGNTPNYLRPASFFKENFIIRKMKKWLKVS